MAVRSLAVSAASMRGVGRNLRAKKLGAGWFQSFVRLSSLNMREWPVLASPGSMYVVSMPVMGSPKC